MSRTNDRSRDAVLKSLKTQIEEGSLDLKNLGNYNYGATTDEYIYLQSADYKDLALHALEKNKMVTFDLIAESQAEALAQELQLAKLKKEIDNGNPPVITAQFFCTETHTEVREVINGFVSGPQDHERRETVDREEKVPIQLSSTNQVALVNHALEKDPIIAKALVVKLSFNDLKTFAQNSGLKETVTEETERRQKEAQKLGILIKLDKLGSEIKTLKKEYEGRYSSFIWNSTNKGKIIEAGEMLTEVTRLKDLLTNKENQTKPWTLDETKTALADKKTLHGHATKLSELKKQVERFQPAPSAAAALSK